MAMNVGSSGSSGDPEVMIDINTTPLIDVMLVPEPISASLGAATATDFVQD